MNALIRFKDGAMIQIARPDNGATPVNNAMATRATASLQETMERLDPLVSPICSHVKRLAKANGASDAEIKLGISFTAEGDLYIVKGSAEISVEISLTLAGGKGTSK